MTNTVTEGEAHPRGARASAARGNDTQASEARTREAQARKAEVSEMQADETQIRELVEDRAAAIRAGDAERLAGWYAPGAVTFTLAPPLRNAGPEVRDPAVLRAWFATFDGPVDYEVRDLEVTAGDDVAFCHSLNRMSATPRGMSEPFTLWLRATVCLRKVDGRWLVAHEHTSTPFYMDGSFRAALDLSP